MRSIILICLIFVNVILKCQNKTDKEKVTYFLTNHKYKQALKLCNNNLSISQTKSDLINHSWFLSVKGIIYLDTINADSGKIFCEKSLNEAYKIGNKKSICNSLHGIGKYYYRTNEFKLALKHFEFLNNYSINIKDKNYELISNYYSGAIYYFLKSYRKALSYDLKACKLAIETKDTADYIRTILAIGSQYEALRIIDSTDYYYSLANTVFLKYSKKTNNTEAVINDALVKINILKQNYTNGIKFGHRAINAAIKDNNYSILNVYYDNTAICYTNLKQYDSAYFYYDKALELELKYNYIYEYKEDLKELIFISKLTQNNIKAFFYIDRYIASDSLYQNSNSDVIDSLKIAFEKEKAELTLKTEKEKIQDAYKKKQIIYIAIVIILLLLVTIIPYLFYLRKRITIEKEKQNLLIQVKDSEIKALQSQMNPHFIFNSLNSVLEFISKSEKDNSIKFLTKFSRLIRLVLEHSNKKTIVLADEIELLNLYIELEKIKTENGFNFTFKIDKDLDVQDYEIPAMLIQPFIENSIIHGIQNKIKISEQEKKMYKGELKVSFIKSKDFLKCIIEDNGIGRRKALEIKNNKSFNHLSLGMRITKNRLNLISESKCKIEYIDLKDATNNSIGTRAEILIPLIENF